MPEPIKIPTSDIDKINYVFITIGTFLNTLFLFGMIFLPYLNKIGLIDESVANSLAVWDWLLVFPAAFLADCAVLVVSVISLFLAIKHKNFKLLIPVPIGLGVNLILIITLFLIGWAIGA